MNLSKPPISIWIVACLYIAVGVIGFVHNFRELRHPDGVLIEVTELLALLAGAFMLRGRNWARWLALAWMAFHLVLSAFEMSHNLIMHLLIFAAIAWLLFRSDARQYFRGNGSAAVSG